MPGTQHPVGLLCGTRPRANAVLCRHPRSRVASAMAQQMQIKLKRAYDEPAGGDGYRVLVDRVWPRGVKKDALQLDATMKELAPSTALRKWFNHEPAKWDAFRKRYFAELNDQPAAVEKLRQKARKGIVTLVYAAKDEQHNNAVALREQLIGKGR